MPSDKWHSSSNSTIPPVNYSTAPSGAELRSLSRLGFRAWRRRWGGMSGDLRLVVRDRWGQRSGFAPPYAGFVGDRLLPVCERVLVQLLQNSADRFSDGASH